MDTSSKRHRCRNLRCRTKLSVPTDNHHKAFCTQYCYDQFFARKCRVCEKPLSEGHRRQLCAKPECARDWRNFRPTSYHRGLTAKLMQKVPILRASKLIKKRLRRPASSLAQPCPILASGQRP
jgi:hypothetical protein